MRRAIAILATLACCVGIVGVPAQPASADSVTVGQTGWSVALTFPDMQWASNSCQFLPVSAVVTGADVQSWTFGGFVSASDVEEDYDDDSYTWFIDYDHMVSTGPGSFGFRHAVLLCPDYDTAGTYEVVGEVGAQLAGAPGWTWLPYRATFTLTGIPTATTLDPIHVIAGVGLFTGRVDTTQPMPATFTGCRSYVMIEALQGDEWEGLRGTQAGSDGTFTQEIPTNELRATEYRARSAGAICGESLSEVRALPVRLPTVTLESVSKGSKLKVDIDPNRGRKSWAFQVQRRIGDDTWRSVGTYRTRGSRETRTINVRKGEYRIRVTAQAGYAETYSSSAWIER